MMGEPFKAWLGFATENCQPGFGIAGKIVDGVVYNDLWLWEVGKPVY